MKKLIRKSQLFIVLAALTTIAPVVAQTVPDYVSTNGLVSWYPFTGNANDFSGNNNHAAVNEAMLTTDRFGVGNAAYSFNGSSAYLHGDASAFPTVYRSVSLWFYSTNINVGASGMQVLGYGGGLCEQSWLMQMDNQSPSTAFLTDNTYELALGCNVFVTALPFAISTPEPNNNWHHWVVSNGPAGVDFYIDGVFAGGITSPIGGTEVAGKKFFIGSCPESTGMLPFQDNYLSNWNGKLDDIGIWNRPLTQQEVTQLYNGGSVGIHTDAMQNTYTVYPNPTQNEITVEVDESLVGATFSLCDIYGKVLIEGSIDKANYKFDIGTLPIGMYFLSLENHSLRSVKVIKN
jgi:hypothetical protein